MSASIDAFSPSTSPQTRLIPELSAPREQTLGYEPKCNIHIGVAEIASRLQKTGMDPPLVAAAY
jgi:hypothetical protein